MLSALAIRSSTGLCARLNGTLEDRGQIPQLARSRSPSMLNIRLVYTVATTSVQVYRMGSCMAVRAYCQLLPVLFSCRYAVLHMRYGWLRGAEGLHFSAFHCFGDGDGSAVVWIHSYTPELPHPAAQISYTLPADVGVISEDCGDKVMQNTSPSQVYVSIQPLSPFHTQIIHTDSLTHSSHTNRNIHTRHLYIPHTPSLCVITHTCIICPTHTTYSCFISHSNTHTQSLTNAHTLPADVGVNKEDCGDKVMLCTTESTSPSQVYVSIQPLSPFHTQIIPTYILTHSLTHSSHTNRNTHTSSLNKKTYSLPV